MGQETVRLTDRKTLTTNSSVTSMFAIFRNRRLPLYEMREVMTRLSGRIPAELEGLINEDLKKYGTRLGSMLIRFPAMKILVRIACQLNE